jgi:DNA-binding response OmpR family regulator
MADSVQVHLEAEVKPSSIPRILLVEDDDDIRDLTVENLKESGFHVVTASNVVDAIKLIASESFDVLLSDMHLPHAGDGMTVVSAMRHSNPEAVTFIYSSFPEMQRAAAELLAQTDEVLVKPLRQDVLDTKIRERLRKGPVRQEAVKTLAAILEEEAGFTIKEWLRRVRLEPELMAVSLEDEDRCAHLPAILKDLVYRLRFPQPLGSRALSSPAAARHGLIRRKQGYTAAMMVEESRMLQVSIFQTLQNNLRRINFSQVLVGVMAIADEVDSQLSQAMSHYVLESNLDDQPVTP